MPLYEVDLDHRAEEFFVERLSLGNTLAKFLLQQIETQDGRFIAVLNRSVDEDRIYGFSEGYQPQNIDIHTRLEPVVTARPQVAQYVKTFLCEPNRLCVFEDVNSKPDDPWISDRPVPWLRYQDEVLYEVRHDDRDSDQLIDRAISRSWSWLFTGAFIRLPSQHQVDQIPRVLTKEQMMRIADHVLEVVIGAYDQEGFLIWRRT